MFSCCCAAEEEGVQEIPADDEQEAETGKGIVASQAILSSQGAAPAPGAAPPPQEEDTDEVFLFALARAAEVLPLGAELDPSGSTAIHVCSVSEEDSLVARENANPSRPPNRRLQAGDFISEVNASSGNPMGMLRDVLSLEHVTMKVRKPVQFTVELDCAGQRFGCGICYDDTSGRSLVVESVGEGLIMDWNKAHPDMAVRPGDRIVSVNGESGTAAQLVKHVTNARDRATIVFSRPHGL